MRRVCLIIFFVCLMTLTANADTMTWTDGSGDHLWSNANNWSDGTTSPPATWPPASATESYYIPGGPTTGTITADATWTGGLLMMSRGGGSTASTTLTINNDAVTLTMVKSGSTEIVSMSYDDSSTGIINHSAGKFVIGNTAGTGELRMTHSAYGPQDKVTYNLSGTGVLDVEILSRGDKAASNASFNATGGTLIVRNNIIKWGLTSAGFPGFHQGGCTLEPEGIGVIGDMSTGTSGNNMDYFMDNPISKVRFDLGNGNSDPTLSSNDKITAFGDFTLNGDLLVNFMGTHAVGDKWNVITVDASMRASDLILGAFDNIPANIQVNLLDTNADTRIDTVQLEEIPEPATIALLGLGALVAVRRSRRK